MRKINKSSLWILLITFSTSLTEDLPLDAPCQVRHLKGRCMLLPTCKFAIEHINHYNDTLLEKILFCGRLNIVTKVCCPVSIAITENDLQDESKIHFQQEDTTTIAPPISTTVSTIVEADTTLPSRNVCGKQFLEDRIVGGEIASLFDFPWIVRLLTQTTSTLKRYSCSGTLITNRHVLTAAHCFSRAKLISIRLGEWDSAKEVDCEYTECSDPPQDRNVSRIIIHPDFMLKYHSSNDIAILVMDQPVVFTNFIKPICLPTTEYVARQDYTNDIVYTTAGWGITEFGSESDRKRKVLLNAVSYNLCRALLNLDPDDDPSVICAGGEKNKDTCQGDSGGPLIGQVIEDNSINKYLFGITSIGFGFCGQQGVPAIYTRVSKYMPWIRNTILIE